MKHRTTYILPAACILAALFLSPRAHGQPGTDFATKGSVEVGGNIGFLSTTPVVDGVAGSATTVVQFSPFVGYFLADEFELGFDPFSFVSTSHDDHSVTQILILLAPSYNVRLGSTAYPFFEGLVGLSSVSDGSTASGVAWGFRGGVKVAVTGKGLLNIGLEYLQENLNPSGAVNRYGFNELSVQAGFTVWF